MKVNQIYMDPSILDTREFKNSLDNPEEVSEKKRALLKEVLEVADKIMSASQLLIFKAVIQGHRISQLARVHGKARSTYYTLYHRGLIKLRRYFLKKEEVKKRHVDKEGLKEINSRPWDLYNYWDSDKKPKRKHGNNQRKSKKRKK